MLGCVTGVQAQVALSKEEKTAFSWEQSASLQPGMMLMQSLSLEMMVFSVGYEYALGLSPWSLTFALHGCYSEEETSYYEGYEAKDFTIENKALGFGLGLRRYFGNHFKGAFASIQSDYTYGLKKDVEWVFASVNGGFYPKRSKEYLSLTQTILGYKFQWERVFLEAGSGAGLYITENKFGTDPDIRSNFVLNLNIGSSFGGPSEKIATANPVKSPHQYALSLDFAQTIFLSTGQESFIVPVTFELPLGYQGLHALLGLSGGGYRSKGNNESLPMWSLNLGGGMGLRKYLAGGNAGAYGQVRADYIFGESNNESYNKGQVIQVDRRQSWMSQGSVGYVAKWDTFMLGASGGLFFLSMEDYKSLTPMVELYAGFPFGASK